MQAGPRLIHQCLAELLGTFLLVLFGTGAVYVAVVCGGLVGLMQVALVWGFAVAMAIYCLGGISGAHINPAVTIAAWAWRGFPRKSVLPYLASQLFGAVLAATLLYLLFGGLLASFEREKSITRGAHGSEASAMVFGEYFPSPAMHGTGPASNETVSILQATAAEAIGTAILVFLVFMLTEPANQGRPSTALVPLAIGLGLAILICLIAPITQAGFNPARDFGPRLVAWIAGWKNIAIPGPRGGFFTVYIAAPILGGLLGGALHELVARPMRAAAAAANTT